MQPYSDFFDFELLAALSKWQKGWYEIQETRRAIADELVAQCYKLPNEFKKYDGPCYRKRFTLNGELIPILEKNELFEGIASWSTKIDNLRIFKGYIKADTNFAMVFKHTPEPTEIVVNIPSLWANEHFVIAANKFKQDRPEDAKALFNFQDYQSEIVLRSTLRGSEIEDIVGTSSPFEVLCDRAGIAKENREKLSINYAKNPNGILIELPGFAGPEATARAIEKVKAKWEKRKNEIIAYNGTIDYSRSYFVHVDDLKHKPK